jgi:hypothetical protein
MLHSISLPVSVFRAESPIKRVKATSSHHVSVAVTGSQKPAWSGGGYGIDGSQEGIAM